MKNNLQTILTLVIVFLFNPLSAQVTPSIEWQKSLGGSYDDRAYSIQQTIDGGFIVAGSIWSNDGDISGNHGYEDYWVVKLDPFGNLVWERSYGGSSIDEATSIQQTTDGGFVVAGWSSSNDGDVTGNSGSDDYWIVKLDSVGNIQWEKSVEGPTNSFTTAIQQTSDGGFIVAGYTYSSSGDYWIVKLDTIGNVVWEKQLGGSMADIATSIQQTTDGRFIVAGYSDSNNGDVSGNHGQEDYWIVRLDTDGNLVWEKSYGGSYDDRAYSIKQTTDGNFIVAGFSGSRDGDVTGSHGDDYWIVKLDTAGNIIWEKCFGGTYGDFAYSIQQTIDGGFIVVGNSTSNDDDVTGNHGLIDYWIIKLDRDGNLTWEKSLGGSEDDRATCVQQTTDRGFIISGFSDSNNGDVSGNHGPFYNMDDYWIVKLTADIATGMSQLSKDISIFPNPVQNQFNINCAINQNSQLLITNAFGQIVKSITLSPSSQNKIISTNNLPNGMYLVTLQEGDEVVSKKVVIEK